MRELQVELDARFLDLRDSRTGPVFFIEHRLSEDDVAGAVLDVGRALLTHPLESGWWQGHRLPLIVTATEVGYRYRGSGTDFWPVLEAEVGVAFSASDRQCVRDLFAGASRFYRGAEPPRTPWAEAFHLISWPITHALVPREFHRPLALALANLRVNITGLTDDELYRAIRIAASTSSARFATFLEDKELTVVVTRKLLGDEGVDLCPDTVARISADLASDQVARRGVAVARRVQRTTPVEGQPEGKGRVAYPAIEGALQLRRRDGNLTLEAAFPALHGDMQVKLRRALRRRRYAARLWGVSTRVPSEQLLSGLPFAVRLTAPPADDALLLAGLEDLDVDRELKDVLASFALDARSPLLFAVASDGEVGRRVRGPSISGHRKYWLLSGSGDGPRGCPALGEVGPYDCRLLDPTEDSGRDALTHLGFQVRFGVSVAFAGAPPLDRESIVPEFAVGDERRVVPRRAPPDGLSVRLSSERTLLTGDGVVTIVIEQGEQTLRVSHGEEERQFRFRGVPTQPAPPPVCSIEARSDDLSVQALLSGALSFGVDSFAPLEGLELTVSAEAAGRALVATAPLAPLPCTLTSAHEPFETLLDDAARSLLTRAPSVTLTLSVGRLCTQTFTLQHRVRPCWWRRGDAGALVLTAELGDLPFGAVPATAPAAPPTQPVIPAPEEAQLLAPVGLDESEYGGAAPFTTFCVAPSRARLEAPAIRKPRLVRRRRATHGALGVEDVAEAYLRWALAESASLIAELRRRQIKESLERWLLEVCCGEEWALREEALGSADPWATLVSVCDETGMGRDSYVELSRQDELEVTRLAVREIRHELPELWARVGPPCDLGPDDYEALDLACGRAYTELAGVYLQRGMEEVAAEVGEGDPGAAAEDWDSVLFRVKSTAELQPLAELLLPTDAAQGLMTLDPSTMTLNELAEELAGWARGAKRALAGSTPPPDALKALLALWVEPEAAVGLDWRAAVDVLIAERPVARAARYLALRSRQASRGGGDS